MSHRALIRLGLLYDSWKVADPTVKRQDMTMFDFAGQSLLRDAPVLVDHDEEVGRVEELVRFPWTDGVWLAARCTIENPPGWLKRGSKASMELYPLAVSDLNGWKYIRRSLIGEVSVLSPSVKPVEACAEVMLLERTQAAVVVDFPAARVRRGRAPVFTGEEISRRLDEAARSGHPAAIELEISHLQRLEGIGALDEVYAKGLRASRQGTHA